MSEHLPRLRTLGLPLRLTLAVTLTFAIAISSVAVLALDLIEDELLEDRRAGAQALLTDYLESIYLGVATVGVVDDRQRTRFFYLDDRGRDISERQYFDAIATNFALTDVGDPLADLLDPGSVLIAEGPLVLGTAGERSTPQNRSVRPSRPAAGAAAGIGLAIGAALDAQAVQGFVEIDPETGRLLDQLGSVVEFRIGPQPVGEPVPVDLGPDQVAMAQTLRLADGTSLQVGVARPLSPVTDGIDTVRRWLLLAVPALVALMAAATWLATSRALRPVRVAVDQARDITDRRLSERLPVPAAKDELRSLATTVNDMLGRLELAQHRQRRLVSDASHELRSPVAASVAQLEVAAAAPQDADWPTTAATVLAEQERLGRLIDDLLALARLDETGLVAPERFDLDLLAAREAARPRPVPVQLSAPAAVQVVGDEAMVTRAVRNLLDNAAHHATGDVLVAVERRDGMAVIDVHDDGPGVPAAERSRIFERFTRVDEARDRQRGGAGLGLAIARQVATTHGGALTCGVSALGGARFTLSLAVSEGDAPGDHDAGNSRPLELARPESSCDRTEVPTS